MGVLSAEEAQGTTGMLPAARQFNLQCCTGIDTAAAAAAAAAAAGPQAC
jgi:hypothetical protein